MQGVGGAAAEAVPGDLREKLGEAKAEAQEKLGEAQGRVEAAKKGDAAYADVIPEDVLGKITDLLSDSLGNGQL